jgi:DNA-binding transcriptional LysR family regulator
MDLTPLQSVAALARHHHMGRAAKALHVCTSTVSKHLAYLERAVDRPLFIRSSQGMVLTAAGQVLLEVVVPCLAAHDAVATTVGRLRNQSIDWIDLGLDGDATAWRIPRFLQSLVSRHPDLSIRLHPCSSHQILEEVQVGRFLAGWILGTEATAAGLETLRLPDLSIRICGPVSRRSWLATASLEDLAVVPWIDRDPDGAMTRHLHTVFPDRQRRPQIVCQLGSVGALEDIVHHLTAFCLVPEEAALAGAERGAWAVWPGRISPLPRYVVTRPALPDDLLRLAFDQAVADVWQR